MNRSKDTPLWVFLAFSSINTRKGALWLIWTSTVFTLYCVPWSLASANQAWLKTVFLLDDWSWFAMMVPITLWYFLSLRWADKNFAWQRTE